jgi:tetratricopeptide (TPR) repeat protein
MAQIIVSALVIASLLALGVRSCMRGFDYSSQYRLAEVDLQAEPDNYAALNNIAQYHLQRAQYEQAIDYARVSIARYPVGSNYINLGVGLQQTQQYTEAFVAYERALTYDNRAIIYENLALLHIVASKPAIAAAFFDRALAEYSHNFKLWIYKAVFEGARANHEGAKTAIMRATQYGEVPPQMYANIINGTPFVVPILDKQVLVQ